MSQQQIRVNLMFDANTQAAQTNIQHLAVLLQKIATPKNITVNSSAIQSAAQAAQSLQVHLQKALNVNTGKLDLARLNMSLKQSNQSLSELSSRLLLAGTQGQQAFVKLSTSIATAGQPAMQLSATISSFLKTMGSAMMWSAAYGALNKITEVIGDAVTYTKDLNKALTDIAIVSDLSAKELDKFAEKAAKAAKNLNSTTTEYAKAALIFYQQGLGGEAVEERANVVTKLAQVTGESAQAVSDQMTAVWNNFDDGTKSLEYYADAITALGAATASSSKEITQGLEKFAAIADTVGLSYEYATAALATVVANTRQSADVVGTAFKTLFARIQDLELGETLDDGVTLGKYSQAIKAVGVDIMTQNGEMKKMDVILDELGAKWDNLSKAQQTSLAQTVAGMRQYTQFIAIMDNYDEFKGNVKIASGAEGTLTEQWETWADSYEGAAKRVEQRSNELYEALLDDDFVIDMTNAFASLIGTVGSAVDAIGGLGPILLTIIALFSKQLMPFVTQFGVHMASAWQLATGKAYENATAMRQATKEHIDLLIQSKALTENYKEQAAITSSMLGVRNSLEKASRFLNATQKEELTTQMQLVETLGLQAQGYYEVADAARKAAQESRKNVSNQFGNEITRASRAFAGTAAGQGRTDLNTFGYDKAKTIFGQTQDTYVSEASAYFGKGGNDKIARQVYNKMRTEALGLGNSVNGSPQTTANMDISIERIEQLTTSQIKYDQAVRQAESALETLNAELQNGGSSSETMEAQVQEQYAALKKLGAELGVTEDKYKSLFNETDAADVKLKKIKDAFLALKSGASTSSNALREVVNSMLANDNISDELRASLEALRNAMIREAEATQNAKTADQQYQVALERMNSLLQKNQVGLSFYVTGLARIAGQASMAISALQMLSNLDFENNSMQSWMTLLMSMSMLLPVILGLITGITTAKNILGAVSAINIGLKEKENKLDAEGLALQYLETKGIESDTAARWANVAAQIAQYWYIGLIIAIIAALIAILVILVKSQKSATEKAAESKAGMESLATAYEEAKNAAAELQEQIKKFKDLDDSLDGLDQGTEEYNQKLKEVNEEAKKLIKQFNLLRGIDWNWEGGRIVIKASSLDNIQNEADAKAEQLEDNANLATRQYLSDQRAAILEENAKSGSGAQDTGWDMHDHGLEILENAAQWYRDNEGLVTKDDFKQWYSEGAGGIARGFAVSHIEKEIDYQFQQIQKTAEDFEKLDEAVQEANRALTEDFVEGIYGIDFRTAATNSEGVVDEALENQLNQAMTTLTDNSATRAKMQAEIDDIEFTVNNNNNVKNLNSDTARKLKYNEIDNDQALAKKYAEVMLGATEEELANFTYTAGDNQGKFKFGTDGTEHEYSDDYMREQLYRYALEQDLIAKYQGDLTAETEAQKNALLNIVQTANADMGGAILDAITAGDIENLNISKLMAQMDESDVQEMQNMSADALLLKMGLSEADLTALGIAKEDLLNQVQQNLENWDFDTYMAATNEKAEQTAESLGLDAEAFKTYRDELALTNTELAKTPQLLNDVAIANMRLSKGLDAISSNYEDWSNAIKGGENSYEAIQAAAEIRKTLGDVLNIDTSELDSSFLTSTEVMNAMKDAANGDADAVERLRELAAQQIVIEAGIDTATPDGKNILDIIEAVNDEDIEVGATIDDSQFMQQLYMMLNAVGTTTEDMQKIFNSMGWTPEIAYQDIEVTQAMKNQGSYTTPDGKVHSIGAEVAVGSKIQFPYFKTDEQGMPSITYRGKATTSTTKKKDKGGSKKEKKKNEDEIERYHKIDKTLDSLSKHYDRLAVARDRAFGASHISYLEAELDVLDKQNEAIKQKIAENEAYYKQDRSVMEGYGAVFDEDGNIANYDELVAQQVAMYNKNPEKNEEKYTAFKEALSRYEETLSVMQDLTDQEIENINNSFDTKLAIITYQVELQVRLADNWNDFFEFQLANLTDSVQDLADKLDILGQSFTQIERKLKSTETALKGYLEQGGVKWEDLQTALKSGTPLTDFLKDANFTEEQISSIESELQNMYSYVDELREGADAISESIVATFEDGHKEFDKATEQMEHFVSLAGAYEDIIDLAGRQALGISQSVLTAIKSSTLDISKSNIAMRKAQLDADKTALEAMRKELALQTDEGAKKEMQEAIDEIESQVRKSEEALLDETSTGLQAATDLFQSQMDGIVEAFEDSMTGAYGTFASLKDSYDQKKEQEDWYLEDYERIYELSKLNRDIVNSIDETDSVHAKELLRDLQAEINQLQEDGTDLTKHEVEYLRAKYELRLAEIALEEAQNAKSQVRMRRDSEGNWGYVYTADENKVGNAMQNYEDKLFAAQKTLDDTIEAMEERLISIPEEFANKVAEIYADQTLNDEERRKRIEETTQHYQTMYANAANLLEATTGKAKELYEVDWTAYSQATGYKISKNSEWVDSFKETFIGTLQGFTSADGALGQFKTQTKTMLDEAARCYTTYRTNVKEILNTAGLDVQNFVGGDKSGVAQQFQNMATEAGKTSTAVQQLATDFTTAFTTAVNTASGQYSAYSTAISKWVTDTDKLADSINKVIEAYATLNKANTEKKTPSTESTPTDGGDGDKSGNPGDGGDTCSKCGKKKSKCTCGKTTTKKLPVNVQLYLISSLQSGFESVKLDKGTVFSSASLTGQSDGSYYFSGTIKGQKSAVGGYIDPDTAQYLKDAGWKKFDTGGYTGSWDSSGRLAMLHQKELVLNAHDTENFLSALDILREITSVIDLQAAAHSNALSAMTSSHLTSMLQPIEQTVTIHAEFPNATQHSEIEEAFNSLLNRASQFANRKNL